MEPRARAARQKGQLNFEAEIAQMLYAYGDHPSPLPETIRTLDEITTDFLIEVCHQASRAASYAGRQKVKVDDFKFVIRKDEKMLGRVEELLSMEKELSRTRRQFNVEELEKGKGVGVGAGVVGVGGKKDEEGKGKGRRGGGLGRKRKVRDGEGGARANPNTSADTMTATGGGEDGDGGEDWEDMDG
ncbi:Transcription initiation factor TFIID subunit 13 [Varicellaria rhodocarpa]|nr:Transcription initiation factor TFIID subunit 13 [Varicellaria rhodocarpa]